MRVGACTLQQTLTTEAASVLKQSLGLARRRGHAQVTPLHVAATLLSSRSSLLRRACLNSSSTSNNSCPPNPPYQHQQYHQYHPLQCRALELCFNVALNRLPTAPLPLLHGQPSLSNALIAALKRAQAHQRRGSIEQNQHQHHQQQQNQQQLQQPLLAIKVELEQLVLSILDDPSVSRVMREAGFSSTAVKTCLEDTSIFHCYSTTTPGGVFSSPCSPTRTDSYTGNLFQTHFMFPLQKKTQILDNSEDVKLVFEVLLRKKRKNTVIVGDSSPLIESLVGELTERVEKGDVPEGLKQTHFIKFQFSSVPLRFMKKEEVDQNLTDLKKKVDFFLESDSGVIVYTGDLKWTVLETSESADNEHYKPVDHLVEEIGRMVYEYSNLGRRVWLLATANYKTYLKCQMRQPSSLELQWSLQAVSVPSGGLGLSLHATSLSQKPCEKFEAKPFIRKEEEDRLNCCVECTSCYEKEAAFLKSGQMKSPLSIFSSTSSKDIDNGSTQLPCWLRSLEPDSQHKDVLAELRRKWNRFCNSFHPGRNNSKHYITGKGYSSSLAYNPCWPDQKKVHQDSNSISFMTHSPSRINHTAASFPRFRRQQSCHIEFSLSNKDSGGPTLDFLKDTTTKEANITLALGNSCSLETEIIKKLQENVPWQRETVPSIVEVLNKTNLAKMNAWFLIEGNDSVGKRRLAMAISESVLGSPDLLLQMNMKDRDKSNKSCYETLNEALRNRRKMVALVENVEFADANFQKFLADGYETGKFGELTTGEVIFILTKDDPSSCSAKNPDSIIQMRFEFCEKSPNLNSKRKVEWENDQNKSKSPRRGAKGADILDLNMRAKEEEEEEDENQEKSEEFSSPNSSNLTQEATNDPQGFLVPIKNRFVFDRNPAEEILALEMFISMMRGSFEEVQRDQEKKCIFSVEERLVEEMVIGSGSFTNSLFEKWLIEVFQTSLEKFKIGGKEGIGVRLCLDLDGGKEEIGVRLCLDGGKGGDCGGGGGNNGFLGSNLPKKIQVSFIG